MLRTDAAKSKILYQYVCKNPLCLKVWYGRVHFKRCVACSSPNIEKKLAESLPWTEKPKPVVPTRKNWKHGIPSRRGLRYMRMKSVLLEKGKSKIEKGYDLACRTGLYLAPGERRPTCGDASRMRTLSQRPSGSKEEMIQLEKLYQDFLMSGLKERSRRLIFPHLTPSQRATLRLQERRCTREEMASCFGVTRSAVQKRLARIEEKLHKLSKKMPSVDDYRIFLARLGTV